MRTTRMQAALRMDAPSSMPGTAQPRRRDDTNRRVIEDGAPHDLIGAGGRYAALHRAWIDSLA